MGLAAIAYDTSELVTTPGFTRPDANILAFPSEYSVYTYYLQQKWLYFNNLLHKL